MPRRKPKSARQKKADTQLKRAIKRGDVSPPDPQKKTHKPKLRRGPTGIFIGSVSDPARAATVYAVKRLQSSFITLSSEFLEETKVLASKLPLPRPIPNTTVIYVEDFHSHGSSDQKLTCPRRPKWRFEMTKKEVEHNEEGMFKKWLDDMDRLVLNWQNSGAPEWKDEPPLDTQFMNKEPDVMPRSPTYFERNLEVWRQLWRVTEISQILLVLLDSRCPILHFPPSLASYLSDRKIILVLTKVDITGPERTSAWVEYFHKNYPHLPVVQVESYTAKEEGAGHQGRARYEAHLPSGFRERLVAVIRQVHAEMLLPPEKVLTNPKWLSTWKPPVRADINWDNVIKVLDSRAGSATSNCEKETEGEQGGSRRLGEDRDLEFLTIGLIGQPNVGKSSLLNALFGVNKVRASKTPGKTKHFQTLFWTPDVRLVDCPGLVMPNFVHMEMQVLSGILPISRVSAISSSIFYAAERLPIERVYGLEHPGLLLAPIVDKRTWRNGAGPNLEANKSLVWTAMDILIAYANQKRWVTAKAGRPDIHRAGNAILRALTDGRVGWAFWPPDIDLKIIGENMEGQGIGLWIPRATDNENEMDDSDDDETDENEETVMSAATSDEEMVQEDSSSELESGEEDKIYGISRFGALSIDDVEDEEEYED